MGTGGFGYQNKQTNIKHEVRVVGGIDRNIWSETERAVDMSLGHFFSTIKGVTDGMNKEYSLLKNNCIR